MDEHIDRISTLINSSPAHTRRSMGEILIYIETHAPQAVMQSLTHALAGAHELMAHALHEPAPRPFGGIVSQFNGDDGRSLQLDGLGGQAYHTQYGHA